MPFSQWERKDEHGVARKEMITMQRDASSLRAKIRSFAQPGVANSSMAFLQRLLPILVFVASSAAQQRAGTIVFTHAPDGGPPWPIEDIYAMDADGANVRALTQDGHSHNPVWSPDGRQILFVHDSALRTPARQEDKQFESHHPVELELMDGEGSNRHLLWRSASAIFSAAWSPDGKELAVSMASQGSANRSPSGSESMRCGLFLLSADGQGEPRLLFRDALTPAWSPDGTKLAFSVERPRGQWAIHVAGVDGSNDVQLTEPPLMAGSPVWSPNGKLIAFDEFADQRHQQIFIMEPDGSHRRQITADGNWSCGHPSWSPDGKRLIFSCRSASPCGGVSSVGTLLPECTRRLFSISPFDPETKPVQLSERDGMNPQFTPSR
jgi:Tol biopolymer transport system component